MGTPDEIEPETKKGVEYKDGRIIFNCGEGGESFELAPETFLFPNHPGYYLHRWGEGITWFPDENGDTE